MYVAAVPEAFPSNVATMTPTFPEYTFVPVNVALGINLNLKSLSWKPKKPVIAVPLLAYLNSTPLSWLLSAVECVPPTPDPRTTTGSTNVDTVESTVRVVP